LLECNLTTLQVRLGHLQVTCYVSCYLWRPNRGQPKTVSHLFQTLVSRYSNGLLKWFASTMIEFLDAVGILISYIFKIKWIIYCYQCLSFFKILSAVHCNIDKEAAKSRDKEWVLVIVKQIVFVFGVSSVTTQSCCLEFSVTSNIWSCCFGVVSHQ